MLFHRISVSIILFFCAVIAIAQKNISVNATVDKNKILIGEPMQLTVEEKILQNAKLHFFYIDSINHFEFLGKPQFDTIRNDKEITIRAIYKLTSFDSGHWVIPSFVFSKKLKTIAIPVDVVFSDFDPNQNYHDIKSIIEVNPKKEKLDWRYYIPGAVIIIAIVIWLLARKKKPTVAPVKEIDAYKEAIQSLKQIRKKKISGKEYYSELVNVFRQYIAHRKNIQSFQKTTDDLVVQLQNLQMNQEEFSRLSDVLHLSDWVKFAKYIPTKEEDENIFVTIKKSIQSIEQINS